MRDLNLSFDFAEADIQLPAIVRSAVARMAQSGNEERGAIFTRREVVEFVLDLVGYSAPKLLHRCRILEPSFGGGDFLVPIVDRLVASYRKDSKRKFEMLQAALRGVELHEATFIKTKKLLFDVLRKKRFTEFEVEALLNAWLKSGDFLLEPFTADFDLVVGNPPYVRQELVPDELLREYRRRYTTIYDRADIYVPFIEQSLRLLKLGGSLGFICADRWMKNRYGGPLRKLVGDSFHLKFYVDMVDTPAFHTDVIAYPAITVISREKKGATRLARRPAIESSSLQALAQEMMSANYPTSTDVKEFMCVAEGDTPWVLESSDQIAIVRRLEEQFPALEDAGCRVGIGVATGADKVYIGKYDELDVESSRKVPLAMTRDIDSGEVDWRGFGVINPFEEDGRLVDLAKYPKLAAFFEKHSAEIQKRHVAKRNETGWFRTIDRITPSLTFKPKLLIPDIKGEANIVFEPGKLYPHHNLYFITSDEWDLKALRAVLMSGIARLFVATYSTRMRGGFLRFQAQYLRRIRLPRWADVSPKLRDRLVHAAEKGDLKACNEAAFEVYHLDAAERLALSGISSNGDRTGGLSA